MKKRSLLAILTCMILFTAAFQCTFSVHAMGIPHEILEYMNSHGMDPFSIENQERAALATGINPVTGQPISNEYRRKLEAKYGGDSSTSTPAASTPETGQTEKPTPAVQKHEHTYSSEITKEPTCTEPGEETFTCDECVASYVDEVAPLDHDYVESTTKAASCTEEGEMSYACSRCDDTYTEAIPAVGHRYSENYTVDLEPTCTTDGEQSKHCLVCDGKTEITTIPASGHVESVSYEVSAPATMFAAGEEVMHCAVCRDVIATRVIPQDTGSLYALIGGIVAAVIVVIAIIFVVAKRRKASNTASAGDSK